MMATDDSRATAPRRRARATAAMLAVLATASLGACTQDGDGAAERAPPPSPAAASPPALPAAPPPRFDGLVTLDTHVDIPFDFATAAVDPRSADLQVNLDKMRLGGLDAAFFIVYVGQTQRTSENYIAAQRDAMTKFDAIHRMIEQYPDLIGLARSPDDVERLIEDGRLAAAIGVENGYVIGNDLGLLDRYHELGARYVSLVHNGHNDLADSATPRPDLGDEGPEEHGGISELGRRAVLRMNELGIMVDVSHASKESALDAIAVSRAPVIASHSSVAGVADHPRNMDDETLLALRDNGGVVQIVAFDSYVRYQPPEQLAAMEALRTRLGLPQRLDLNALPEAQRFEYLRGIRDIQQQWPPANVSDFVDHIDYAVRLIGVEHVGISSDFGGGGGVIGWSDASETTNVTTELLRRGYSEEDVARIWSGNLLRVWRDVERIAAADTAAAAAQ